MNLLNVGCGTHYAKGWLNVDVWESDTTRPDVRVEPNQPYPFPDDHFDAIYLGHVLEHVDWPYLPKLLSDIQRIAKPQAKILVVGPDVVKTIHRWAEGKEPWSMVMSVLEHQDFNWQPGRQTEFWDGATHHWNCHHERVWNILNDCGFTNLQDYTDEIPNNTSMTSWLDTQTGVNWPVVAKWFWQFAIHCSVNK
jgi:SAM-dependent methyltransferase